MGRPKRLRTLKNNSKKVRRAIKAFRCVSCAACAVSQLMTVSRQIAQRKQFKQGGVVSGPHEDDEVILLNPKTVLERVKREN